MNEALIPFDVSPAKAVGTFLEPAEYVAGFDSNLLTNESKTWVRKGAPPRPPVGVIGWDSIRKIFTRHWR